MATRFLTVLLATPAFFWIFFLSQFNLGEDTEGQLGLLAVATFTDENELKRVAAAARLSAQERDPRMATIIALTSLAGRLKMKPEDVPAYVDLLMEQAGDDISEKSFRDYYRFRAGVTLDCRSVEGLVDVPRRFVDVAFHAVAGRRTAS